jgi:hypothetical protein
MEGALQANYGGLTAREDIKAPRPTPWPTIANEYRKKISKRMFQRPSRQHAMQVVGFFGCIPLAGWISPRFAVSGLVINTFFAVSTIYNRGEADVPKDDFGMAGEVRPMKRKPMALAVAITAFFWFLGSFTANKMVARGLAPQGMPFRTTLISWLFMLPALFVNVQWIEN